MARDFKLPDLGEGLKEGTLVGWKVKEGDSVAAEQAVAEVETDKATTELPSPYAGKILKLHFKPGDVIPVGSVILTVEESGATAPAKGAPAAKPAANAKPAAAPAAKQPAPVAKPAPAAATPVAKLPAVPAQAPQPAPAAPPAPPQRQLPAAAAVLNPTPILAAPATRKLAREKGVDLKNVRGTGPGGRITQEDVLSFISGGGRPMDDLMAPIGVHGDGGGLTFPRPMLPDFTRFGESERKPASPIRRRIVQAMTLSSQVTAAVTYMDEADVTELEKFRNEAKEITKERGVKLTTLAVVAKACAAALQRFPDFNASYDDDKQEIVYKNYYHIGIAVDSPQGLLVPVLRNADQRPISELAGEIVSLADAARSGKIQREQMQGGTFTITNIGVIGGLGFTPVINWPEVAILGLGRAQERLAFDKDGKTVVARKMLPLCLTFDHRLIDGAAAARFVNAIKEYLENPLLLLMDA
jgi:pyruvate dehydrogenase E2 component (dihydrolipoamide acetyltransferase)